jgi:HD-GYP domain-containing protein (c-di-GMP phosphodiesterase class II)
MRTHTTIGVAIAQPLSSAVPFLSVIRNHHENYDGSGYPDALAADAIPLNARIVAVSDAYDALVSDRPYRRAKTPTEARAILSRGAGQQWDPNLVSIFLSVVLPAVESDAHGPTPLSR